MSIINRSLNKYTPLRWLCVALLLVLPGVFSMAIYYLDEWMDTREYRRERQ